MTKYRVEKNGTGVAIELSDVGDNRKALREAFSECAEGRCSCPTTEYEKVASMRVMGGAHKIAIGLEAKPGSEFRVIEIANCLTHTINTTNGDPRGATVSPKEVTSGGIR